MAFKRFDGFQGSVPQKYIDAKLPKCPMCGTEEPHWTIDMKANFKISLKNMADGNLYLYKCDKCGCILSAPVGDVTGMNKTALTTTGLFKKISGKDNKATYFTVQDVGAMQTTKMYEGKEMTLEELTSIAEGV